jgi:hypothetical protein
MANQPPREMEGRIVFSAFSAFDSQETDKSNANNSGFVPDLHSGERLITGLSQPNDLK